MERFLAMTLNPYRCLTAGLLALTLTVPTLAHADRRVAIDTTQDGGNFNVFPAGRLTVSHATNNPLLTLTGGATTTGASDVLVGSGAGQSGRLRIEAGSQLSNSGIGYLGYAGSSGTATVSGAGSHWQNQDRLYVGFLGSGTGSLLIEKGGQVTSSGGTVGYSAAGTVTVTGEGSRWQVDGMVNVGENGNGTLIVENGGLVSSQWASIDSSGSSTSTAIIAGEGSRWEIQGEISVGDGESGTGVLRVEDGGVVTSARGSLGTWDGSAGAAIVTGEGSRWQSDSLFVGHAGEGTLTVADGGRVATKTLFGSLNDIQGNGTINSSGIVLDGAIEFNGPGSAQQNLTFGNGGTLHLDMSTGEGGLGVGFRDSGTLSITNGAHVVSAFGVLGNSPSHMVYTDARSHGTGVVSGVGSQWDNRTGLLVGDMNSEGTLRIDNGGIVTSALGVIATHRGTGTVTVSGEGSHWSVAGVEYIADSLYVGGGNDSNGTLNIDNGGLVTVTGNTLLGGRGANSNAAVSVSGNNSAWNVQGRVDVGADPNTSWFSGPTHSATLTVEDGGIVFAEDGIYVYHNGVVAGNGGMIVGDVHNLHGTLSPGASPGFLAIDGNYIQGADGELILEIAGLTPGSDYDQLFVSGNASLDGLVTLRFLDGFAPLTGDVFEFLLVGGIQDANGIAVSIENLLPGFEYDLSFSSGGFSLTALNDAVAVPEPSTVVLSAISGLALLGIAIRRRRAIGSPGRCESA